MRQFFRVGNNTFENRGYPWIAQLVAGAQEGDDCPKCGAGAWKAIGDLHALLEEDHKARSWPDVLGCGAYPLFIVSARVLRTWREEKICEPPVAGVVLVDPLPQHLREIAPPSYFWIDGQ